MTDDELDAARGLIDRTDIELGIRDPKNSIERRSVRVLDNMIAELESRLTGLRFVREAMLTHIDK